MPLPPLSEGGEVRKTNKEVSPQTFLCGLNLYQGQVKSLEFNASERIGRKNWIGKYCLNWSYCVWPSCGYAVKHRKAEKLKVKAENPFLC